ncbi:hypothetical protein JCM11641_006292 [Rhodosporidiobolus odoratus]
MGPNTSAKPSTKKGSKSKQGADGGRSSARIYSSKRPVGGKGIFITCVRGKESKCVGEMYDLLEEVADRIYPQERIDRMVTEREALQKEREATEGNAGRGVQGGEPAGVEPTPSSPPAAPAATEDEAAEEDEDDLEASIKRELEALKQGGGGRKTAPSGRGGDGKGKQKERPRFQSIQTDTECLVFIATAWPYDPVELTEAIISDVMATGNARTRVSQRLSPISFSCHSLSVDQVEAQSARLIEQAFASWAEANGKTSLTYAIDPSIRSHTAPLSRALLLPLLGTHCTSLSLPPTICSPIPSRPILTVKADLKLPDLVLLPTVLKNVYGLSVVEGKIWRGKKFNLETTAQEARKRIREEEEKSLGVQQPKVQGDGQSVAVEGNAVPKA